MSRHHKDILKQLYKSADRLPTAYFVAAMGWVMAAVFFVTLVVKGV